MPYQPMLPKLKEGTGCTIKNFDDKGKWRPRSSGELMEIVTSLDAENAELDINSIPDIWARAILFEIALFNKNHSLHKRILGEWRGLLALLALKEVKNFNISIKKLDNKTDSAFYKVIRALAPRKALSRDTSWEKDVFIIQFGREKKSIAITSPTTLVCTATDCYDRIHDVRWCDGRFLQDPVPDLNPQEKLMMLKWLMNLENQLNTNKGINREEYQAEWNTLLAIIGDFITNLGGSQTNISEEIALSANSLGMKTGIFHYLDFPIKKIVEGKSDVFLMPSTGRHPAKQILIVDDAIAGQWDKGEQDITVWGPITLADAIPYGGLQNRTNMVRGESLGNEAEVWIPKEFFTNKLYIILKENALPGELTIKDAKAAPLKHRENIVTPLLPLKPEILEYLNSYDLSQRIRFLKKGDVITARLELPLSGDKIPFVIQKDYDYKKGEVIEIPDVPILEIWPNFSLPEWKSYFFYYSTDDQPKRFYAKPFCLMISESKPSEPGVKEADAESAKQTGEKKTIDQERLVSSIKNRRGTLISEISKMKNFPEALLCYWDTSEYAGLILLDPPSPPKINRNQTWKIGIDFGTTNTTASVSVGDAIPKPIELQGRLMSISNYEKRIRRLFEEFLPSKVVDPPFQSIFHEYPSDKEPNYLSPLIDGHIYFYPNYREFKAMAPGIVSDLKWGEPYERKRAKALIEQLCLQCAAEAISGGEKETAGAKEISWRFSFPTAFSLDEKEEFRKIWDNICDRIKSQTGIVFTSDSPSHKSESVSSAHYFANVKEGIRELNTHKGAVCIDIGGGTSDISIWQSCKGEEYDLRLQTSLRLAGRELFLGLLYQNPEFIQKFIKDNETLKSLTDARESKRAFFAQMDSVIGTEGKRWLEELPTLLGDSKVKDFVQLINVGICGLLYYIGLLLRVLKDQKKYFPVEMPDVYVGGNGAHLLDWIASGSYDQKSQISRLLKNMILEATAFKDIKTNFEIFKSPRLKEEVAYGLVVDEKKLREDSAKITQEQMIAGESFGLNGKDRDWTTPLTSEMLKRGIRIRNISNFLKFLLTFNTFAQQIAKPPISYGDELMGNIVNKVNDQLLTIELEDVKRIRVEPIFVSILKTFLEEKAREWGGKNKS